LPNSDAPLSLPANVRSFLGGRPRFATIATLDSDGSPRQTVVWYLLRGDRIVLNSKAGRRWPSNLLRDPRLSFTVEDGLDYVTLRGAVEADEDQQRSHSDIAEMARRYESAAEAERAIAEFAGQRRISFDFRPRQMHTHGDPR
jgi:PPOX class probable F420-dependent enzyme